MEESTKNIQNNALVDNKKIENWKKNIKNTGNSIYALGWANIFINIALLLLVIFDKNFNELGLPRVGFSSTLIMCAFSFIYIIFGNRIRALKDKNIEKHLLTILYVSVVAFVFTIINGGRVGLLFIILLFYLFSSLSVIKKLMKEEQFASTLIEPNYKLKKKGWRVFSIIAGILIIIGMIIDFTIMKTTIINNDSVVSDNITEQQDIINQGWENEKPGFMSGCNTNNNNYNYCNCLYTKLRNKYQNVNELEAEFNVNGETTPRLVESAKECIGLFNK